jgi:hypothetical protein
MEVCVVCHVLTCLVCWFICKIQVASLLRHTCLGYITPLFGSNRVIVLVLAVTVGYIVNVLYNARDLGIDGSIILHGS